MGTWGTAIFSDDLAADIRDEWRTLIANDVPPADATQRIVADYSSSINDPNERSVFWLALAVTQWQTGRLTDEVRDTALEIIDSGTDLTRWDTQALRTARQKALTKARTQLLSPQPPAKRLPKPQLSATPYVPGDLISYLHDTGTRFLLWILANETDLGGEYSQAEVLDTTDSADPLTNLPAMQLPNQAPLGFILTNATKIPPGRAETIGNIPRPTDRPTPTLFIIDARELDDWLRPFLPGGDHIPHR
jgi:hypothetical protein